MPSANVIAERARCYRNRLARAGPERDAAFALRYVAYRSLGHIDANAAQRFRDEYDDRANCFTFLLHDEDDDSAAEPVGSIRACVHLGTPGWDRLPAEASFAPEIAALAAAGRRLVEVTRLVLRPDHRGSDRAAKLALFANASFVAERFGAHDMLAAVHPDHAPFYRHLFFEPETGPREYLGVHFPTVLMRMPWPDARPALRAHRVFRACWNVPRDADADASIQPPEEVID